MGDFKTDQESFWAGEFGNGYIDRNSSAGLLSSNKEFFARIVSRARRLESVLELGANVGMNLRALRDLLPDSDLAGVEINQSAAEELAKLPGIEVYYDSIIGFESVKAYDLVFTKGVLIHINPDELSQVYDLMHKTSRRYLMVAEYYNPTPVEISYRGHSGKLFKRDFAGEILDRFSDLELVDYGFAYHRDIYFPQDDITWFLMEKMG